MQLACLTIPGIFSYLGLIVARCVSRSLLAANSSTSITCGEFSTHVLANYFYFRVATYRLPISDNAIKLDYIGMFELCHDGCLLKKLDLVLTFC